MDMGLIGNITWKGLTQDQYLREETDKVQIYIHHTAGGPSPFSVVDWWASTDARVGTHYIVGGKKVNYKSNWRDGQIVQCINSKYWAYHLGLTPSHLNVVSGSKSSKWLNSHSITIEICNWGGLREDCGQYYAWTDYKVKEGDTIHYEDGYRGYNYYQRYTDAQLNSLRDILVYFTDKYDIPSEYKGDEIFDVDPRALRGEPGIFTHTSVRPDKSDCHPQPELIEVLRSL